MTSVLANPGDPPTRALPNKPVLPIATNQLDDDSLGALRRQTGKPLGGWACEQNRRRSLPSAIWSKTLV